MGIFLIIFFSNLLTNLKNKLTVDSAVLVWQPIPKIVGECAKNELKLYSKIIKLNFLTFCCVMSLFSNDKLLISTILFTFFRSICQNYSVWHHNSISQILTLINLNSFSTSSLAKSSKPIFNVPSELSGFPCSPNCNGVLASVNRMHCIS